MPEIPSDLLEQQVETLGLAKIERHIFLCADQSKPKCCTRETSAESWDYLKRRIRELGLMQGEKVVYRSKGVALRYQMPSGQTTAVGPPVQNLGRELGLFEKADS